MNKRIFILFFVACLLGSSSFVKGQCTASVSVKGAVGNCNIPATLQVATNFPIQSITWQLGTTPLQTYNAAWTTSGVTVAGGNSAGSNANQLWGAIGVFVDNKGNVYAVDNSNHRIQKWAPGATTGVTIAGGNGAGNGANQFYKPIGVSVVNDTIYVVDQENNRVQRWDPGATSGVTVAGSSTGVGGSALDRLQAPRGLFVAADRSIYIADQNNARIVKWVPGATVGVTVAGGNGSGPGSNQLNVAAGVWVDGNDNVYVADYSNHRVQKWAPGAITGVTVAGTSGSSGNTAALLRNPINIWGDTIGNIYVVDYGNHRIQKWAPGSTSGVTVAGTGSSGTTATQLYGPAGVFVDSAMNNIYVADNSNNRIQKFSRIITDTLVVNNPGTYNVSVTGINGCTATASITIGSSAAGAIATAAGPTTFCWGDSVVIHANKGSAFTYKWQYGTVILPDETRDSIIAKNSGNYVAIVTDNGCTASSLPVTVTAHSLPSLTTNTSTPVICMGKDTLLTVTGAATYSWQPTMGLTPATGATVKASPNATTTYTITGTDNNGCKHSITRVVSVNQLPSVSVSPNSSAMCAGQEKILTASGAATYQWLPATGLSAPTGSTVRATPANTITYKVTGTDNNKCENSATVVLTVHPLPSVNISPAGPIHACEQTPVVITANATGATTYQWKNDSANVGSNAGTFNVSTSGNYKVIVKDANNCSDSSNKVSVTIVPAPAVSIAPLDTAICQGSMVRLNAITNDTGINYQWQENGNDIAMATLPFYSATKAGIYKLIATQNFAGGCSDTGLATIIVHALPVPIITPDGKRISVQAHYKNFQWFFNGQKMNAVGHEINDAPNGTYVVEVVDSNGCIGTSIAYRQQVGITDITSGEHIHVYPNPAGNTIYIDAPIDIMLTMYSMQGKEVLQQAGVSRIDISNLANGLYILRIADMNGVLIKNEKIIKTAW